MNLSHIVYREVSPLDEAVVHLIDRLNQYQIHLYGVEKCNLEPPASLQQSQAFMIGAYSSGKLIGIGAVKLLSDYAEIKRMYVEEEFRGRAIAETILRHLEKYVLEKGIFRICLETGNKHASALAFYKKAGYTEIDKFGHYRPNEVSVYFEKVRF
jgi:putative acetyltransferase